MEDKKAEYILQLFKHMKQIRGPVEKIWIDVAENILPGREDILLSRGEGERQGTKIYDGSPLSALQVFTDGMHGHIISAATPWFQLILDIPISAIMDRRHRGMPRRGPYRPYIGRYDQLDDVPEVRAYLQDTALNLYRSFNRSNFYSAMTGYFEDGGAIGTATVYTERQVAARRTVFTSMHPGQIYIGENQYGEVDTVLRHDKIEAVKLEQKWGRNKLSDEMKTALEHEPFKRFPILHAVYPRNQRDPYKIDSLNMPFASCWVDMTERKVMHDGGYKRMPYKVWRYRKSSIETYGRSPGMLALYDVMGLHKISKAMLGAARLAVEPAYMVPSELEGRVKLTPMGFNYYGKDPKRIIMPIQTDRGIPHGKDREDEKREAIEKFFHVDFFLMLARRPKQETAPAVLELAAEKGALLGTAIGRLNFETLDPAIDAQFDYEYEDGNLPEVPPILQEYGGGRIGVNYHGPLAQAQKRLFSTAPITQGLAGLMPLIELFPEIKDLIHPDETAKQILENHNFPQKAIRGQDVVDAIRQNREKARQMEAIKEQLTGGAETAKTLAEADRATDGQMSQSLQDQGIDLTRVLAAAGGA